MARRRAPAAAAVALAVGLAVMLWPAGVGAEGNKDDVTLGKSLYDVYCFNCHGQGGKGDGPVAGVMTVRPADLTRISANNGGEFPKDRVGSTIDGREQIQAHGERQMPIWGLNFQQMDRDTNQERDVRERIRRLVAYLESIQAPKGER